MCSSTQPRVLSLHPLPRVLPSRPALTTHTELPGAGPSLPCPWTPSMPTPSTKEMQRTITNAKGRMLVSMEGAGGAGPLPPEPALLGQLSLPRESPLGCPGGRLRGEAGRGRAGSSALPRRGAAWGPARWWLPASPREPPPARGSTFPASRLAPSRAGGEGCLIIAGPPEPSGVGHVPSCCLGPLTCDSPTSSAGQQGVSRGRGLMKWQLNQGPEVGRQQDRR